MSIGWQRMYENLEAQYEEAQRTIGRLELRIMHVSLTVKHLHDVRDINLEARDELLRALGEVK